MTQVVVDANVAVKWLVDEEQRQEAARLLQDESDLHAPRVMATEVANVLWQKVERGEIAATGASILADSIQRLPLVWADDEQLIADAVRIAIELGHAAYDCMYLALAHRLGARLVTADMKFVRRAAPTAHRGAIVPLDDYASE